MTINPFQAMQRALDIVETSPHPSNKIAACLFSEDGYHDAKVNHWPDPIAKAIGTDKKIGSSSGTIHAETACLLQAPHTDGASICITDPFCPNCAKNMAEAGIKNIYIDGAGFDKDFFRRRSEHFEVMSMQICEKAGINVYNLSLEDQTIEAIYEVPGSYTPYEESPLEIISIDAPNEIIFKHMVQKAEHEYTRRRFALCFAQKKTADTQNQETFCLIGRAHPFTGLCLSDDDDLQTFERPQGKYSFIQEPVTRLLMAMCKHGLTPLDGYFYCSQVPTSREQVNIIGANITRLTIGNTEKARDNHAFEAMNLLCNSKILHFL